jgi:hypothetical protein
VLQASLRHSLPAAASMSGFSSHGFPADGVLRNIMP